MDATGTRFAKMRRWMCSKGHVLGYIERVKVNDKGRESTETRLNILRHAIDLDAETLVEVDVLGAVESATLNCDVPGCCETKSWYISEDALQRLLERRAARAVENEQSA